MANKRISQLPAAASPLAGGTLLPVELTTGDTKRATIQQLRATLTVTDYGAVGDGTTDDTAAFSAAVTAASATGAAVYVPSVAQFYRLSDEITLPAGVTVIGNGWGSRIRQVTRDKNIFIAGDNTIVRALHLQGDNVTTTSAADKNCGVYADNKSNVTIDGCFATRFQNGLCQFRNVRDYKITDNVCYENPYSVAVGAVNGDITIYSLTSATGQRGIISRNHCLSNNDFGIFVDANGFDLDVVIAENICVTLSGGSEAASGGNRRHALITAYGGSVGGRSIIIGNICRNTRLTGIYRAAASSPTGMHLIANNICTLNGYQNNSLSAGIFLNIAGPGTKVVGNIVESFQGNLNLANGGIVVNNTPTPVEVRDNVVQGSLGHGILVLGTTQDCIVAGNMLRNNATADVAIQHSGNGTAGGGHEIIGNNFFKAVNTKPAIRVVSDASPRAIRITNNCAYGLDKTTASGGENAFLNIEGTSTTPLSVNSNEVERFYYGVYYWTNIQSGRGGNHHAYDNNIFRDLNTGVQALRGSVNDCLPVFSSVFSIVGTAVAGGAYIADRKGAKVALAGLNAAPTDGTWEAGDISWRTAPAAGAAPGDVCTTGGAPGTWKAMANVAA